MKAMTKLFALSALGAGAYAAVRAKRRAAAKTSQMDAFDLSDLDEPVVVTEEVVIVTEAGPYEIDMEMIPGDNQAQNQNQQDKSSFEMPGRGSAPR
jgi:hypothetical protein